MKPEIAVSAQWIMVSNAECKIRRKEGEFFET